MTDPYLHNREFFGSVSGNYRVLAADTGLIALVASIPAHTLFIQKLHIEVTTITGGELWTFQDGAGIPLVPSVSAGAIAHFDFDFGPDGVPCTEATALVLNITGAVGAIGWVTWEGFKKLTLGTSPIVGGAPTAADTGLQTIANLRVLGTALFADGSGAAPSIAFINEPTMGFRRRGVNVFSLMNGQTSAGVMDFSVQTNNEHLNLKASAFLGFSSLNADTNVADVAVSRLSAGTLAIGTGAQGDASAALVAGTVRGKAVTFANLPAAPVEGMVAWVTDSTVNTWGTVIVGGGANHVLACYNGTNWTVAGK